MRGQRGAASAKTLLYAPLFSRFYHREPTTYFTTDTTMLSTKLLLLAFCAAFALTLVGSGTAHPIDAYAELQAKDNLTTTLAARKWGYGPYECTDKDFFCLV